ncbi:MAG: choice-of-anchor D domain-containing protein, partial [Burkholderiales bacterium]|nr:choice-of-anchor D domain-containing protein [Phycisphaerae bacterium]
MRIPFRTLTRLESLEGRVMLAGTPLFRINTGGPSVSAIPLSWSTDTSGAPSQYVNTATSSNNTTSTGSTINLTDPSVPPGTPEAIFKDDRWDSAGGEELQYTFPVTPGRYEVRLYFAETYGGVASVGGRVFDVAIEGAKVADNLDIFAQVGLNKALVKSYTVTADSALNVQLQHQTENPSLAAIEILTAPPQPNALGTSVATLNFGSITSGSSSQKTITLTNLGAAGDPAITLFSTSITGSGFTDSFNDATDIILQPGQTHSITVNFIASAVNNFSATLNVSHSGANSPMQVALSGSGVSSIPIGFSKGGLSGANNQNPTSLQMGPDGRLYVAQQDGVIKIYGVKRNGPHNYAVTSTEVVSLVKNIPNHNDNGQLNPGYTSRLVTGLLVAGTATNPIIYVTSSDPRIGGNSGSVSDLDTNSGIVSRLNWNGSQWTKTDLVRGLPRSKENHTGNGMTLNKTTNTLFIAYGGHTNMGAPSGNFENLPEYALSAAILSINLNMIGNTTYDLPTLDDENRAGTNDLNDPFGGNAGKNQAKIVPGGPVQVYAPGFRNAYDVLLTANGRMYTVDNGANAGWGGIPANEGPNATNAIVNGGPTTLDNLHRVTGPGYYGGHANPTRANKNNTFNTTNPQSPVSVNNPVEGDYRFPGTENGSLTLWDYSTNGLTEYTASNFGGAMKGNLLTASINNSIYRVQLNADGTQALSNTSFFSNVAGVGMALDVWAQGDNDVFPGTVWAADYVGGFILVYEPNDYEQGGSTGTPGVDDDGDGYTNADEIANGTNPFSSGDAPPDWDSDFSSNLLDPDDDNDLQPDNTDPFAIDPNNGRNTALPLAYEWENDGPSAGGIVNLGWTGLMNNGQANYADLYDPSKLTAGAAAGVFTLDEINSGTAFGSTNTQQQAFQFGIDFDQNSTGVVLHTRVLSPWAGNTRLAGQQQGFFFGTGDQNNYVSVVLDGDGTAKMILEVNGSAQVVGSVNVNLTTGAHFDLRLTLTPDGRVTGTVTPVNGVAQTVASNVVIPTAWFSNPAKAPALGAIATAGNSGQTFDATWDFMRVTALPQGNLSGTLTASPSALTFGGVPVNGSGQLNLTLTNAGGAGDPSITINSATFTGTHGAQFITSGFQNNVILAPGESRTFAVLFKPTSAGVKSAGFQVNHNGVNALTVNLSGVGETASNAAAFIDVDPGGGINGSTYNGGSFKLTNNSVGGQTIQSIRIDTTTAILPDVVFDPYGQGGDLTAKDLNVDNAGGVTYAGHNYTLPHDGGFDAMTINFTNFGSGKTFQFSVDNDPTSIKGGSSPGPNDSGSISGLELLGSLVTITFSDGSVQTGYLFHKNNSTSGSQNIIRTGAPAAPAITMIGVASPSVTGSANQTVRVVGTAGSTVTLVILEGGLFTQGLPNGGFDLDPFESNTAIGVVKIDVTVGAGGFVDVPVTLTRANNNSGITGINYVLAAVKESDGRYGRISNKLVVRYDPSLTVNQKPVVNAGADKTGVVSQAIALSGVVTDDSLPQGASVTSAWTMISGPGTVGFASASTPATTATFSQPGTYVLRLTANDTQLSAFDEVTVVVTAGPVQTQTPFS